MATMDLSQFVASAPNILPPLATLFHRQLPKFVGICRQSQRGFIAIKLSATRYHDF
jgi:hypothetical protein